MDECYLTVFRWHCGKMWFTETKTCFALKTAKTKWSGFEEYFFASFFFSECSSTEIADRAEFRGKSFSKTDSLSKNGGSVLSTDFFRAYFTPKTQSRHPSCSCRTCRQFLRRFFRDFSDFRQSCLTTGDPTRSTSWQSFFSESTFFSSSELPCWSSWLASLWWVDVNLKK